MHVKRQRLQLLCRVNNLFLIFYIFEKKVISLGQYLVVSLSIKETSFFEYRIRCI